MDPTSFSGYSICIALAVTSWVGFCRVARGETMKLRELEYVQAARALGVSELRIIFQVMWPLSKPTLVTVGIITFMNTWNDVLWPIIVIRKTEMMTMPQTVALFAVGGQADAQMGSILAAATLLAIPVVIAYTIFQRHFIESMATSGLKG